MRRVRRRQKVKKRATRKRAKPAEPLVVKAAAKRRCIDVALPASKLWICKIGRTRVAFLRGSRFPLGLLVKKRKRKLDVVASIKPFDSLEHEHVAQQLCLPGGNSRIKASQQLF